jgi:hypothetical protein
MPPCCEMRKQAVEPRPAGGSTPCFRQSSVVVGHSGKTLAANGQTGLVDPPTTRPSSVSTHATERVTARGAYVITLPDGIDNLPPRPGDRPRAGRQLHTRLGQHQGAHQLLRGQERCARWCVGCRKPFRLLPLPHLSSDGGGTGGLSHPSHTRLIIIMAHHPSPPLAAEPQSQLARKTPNNAGPTTCHRREVDPRAS